MTPLAWIFWHILKNAAMEIRRTEFPVTLQAFEVRNSKEEFVAEQVVHSQPEVDRFTAQFNGKLIKAHTLRPEEARGTERYPKTRTMSGWAVFLVILVVLLIVAYFTGWLQPFINSLR